MNKSRARVGTIVTSCLALAAVAVSCSSAKELPDGASGSATGGSALGGIGAQVSGGSFNLYAGAPAQEGNQGGEGTSEVTPGAECAKSTEVTTALPPVLELSVDTSGSMDWPPGWAPATPDDSKPPGATKWEITRQALQEAVAALPAEVALGVSFFPNVEQEEGVCLDNELAVPIAPLGESGSGARMTWEAALAAVDPVGATPTHGAYRFGLSKLAESSLPGDKFLLLITDGTPTCDLDCVCTEDNQAVDSQPLISEAAAARAQGIRTFVIGAPGSEQVRDILSRLATEGATAKENCSDSGPSYCHFDMTTEPNLATGLARALEEIATRVRSCSYPIPAPPEGETLDPDLVNVLYTPGSEMESRTISRALDGAGCQEGWQYSSDGLSVVLCTDTCAQVQADADSQLEILFGCETVVQKPR